MKVVLNSEDSVVKLLPLIGRAEYAVLTLSNQELSDKLAHLLQLLVAQSTKRTRLASTLLPYSGNGPGDTLIPLPVSRWEHVVGLHACHTRRNLYDKS